MTDTASVILEARGQAFWITLNRPERRNALNADVIAGVRAGLRQAQGNAAIRVIVITGSGDRAFCAGADLQPGSNFVFDCAQPTTDYADMLRDAYAINLPIVARINGACVAGGMGLLCMADVAIASDHATFGLSEVKVGVFPMQVLSLLQHMVSPRKLREWLDV
jgi:enoyl-CoA hydratase/carnithine racemase